MRFVKAIAIAGFARRDYGWIQIMVLPDGDPVIFPEANRIVKLAHSTMIE